MPGRLYGHNGKHQPTYKKLRSDRELRKTFFNPPKPSKVQRALSDARYRWFDLVGCLLVIAIYAAITALVLDLIFGWPW